MRTTMRKLTALVLAIVCLALCAGCSYTQSIEEQLAGIPRSTGGKDIERTVGADEYFSLNCNRKYSFNPLVATNHSNQLVCSLVFENMVELDDNFEVIPNLITAWSCTEDGKSWTLTVATDHYFHDGTQVTARDLVYSLDRSIYADRFSGRFSSYQGASYWGDDTMVVTLGIGDTQFIKLLNIPVIKVGTYAETYPTGSGPYTFNEDGSALVAYDNYVMTQVNTIAELDDNGKETGRTTTELVSVTPELPTKCVRLVEYKDAQTTLSAFENSTIDVVINDPSSYTNIGYASTNEIRSYATTNLHFIAFNEETTLGKYSTFRYAMNFAFDREYLVEMLHGDGVASSVPMYPTVDIYPVSLANSLSYNLENCRIVLANAGIQDYDEDGKLEFMNGSPQEIELVLIVCSDSSAKVGLANRFAEDMASIGLTIKVKSLTWDNYMEALKEGEFDMYYGEIRLRNNFDLTELLQVREKKQLKEGEEDTYKGPNFTGGTDTRYVDYLNSYLGASDAMRAERYQEFAVYLANNASVIALGFEKQQIITHRGIIKGVAPNFGNPLYNFPNWSIDLLDKDEIPEVVITPEPTDTEGEKS